MKTGFKIMLTLIVALMFSSCAGLQNKEMPALAQPLPEMVPESFHFNVQDTSTRRYLATTDPDAFPPDRRLEVLILGELARVSTEKELPKVFDRLWEDQEEIRELVGRPEQAGVYIRPLVEIY